MIRAVAGLGVFKLNAVGVEGLAGDDSHAVVVVHIQIGFVHLCDPLHGHGPFAGGDSEAKRLLQILIDGMLCDFGGQSRHQFFQKVIVIQDQRDIIQIPEPLQVVELGSHRKAGPSGDFFARFQFGELQNLRPGLLMVAEGRFQKGFNAAYRKGGLSHGLKNIADAFPLHGLYIAV